MIRGGVKEIHYGKVLSNEDPAGNGGLKVQVDTLVDGASLGKDFIPPTFPFAGADEGFFFVPEKGALVEIEVTADNARSTESPAARWRAVLYTDKDAIPAEFKTNPAKRGGIKFGAGVLLFDKLLDLLALVSSNVRLGTEAASHPLLRGDAFSDDLGTFLDAVTTFQNAVKIPIGVWAALTPGIPATTDMFIAYAVAVDAALVTFLSDVASFKAARAAWLSTRCKTE